MTWKFDEQIHSIVWFWFLVEKLINKSKLIKLTVFFFLNVAQIKYYNTRRRVALCLSSLIIRI